MRIWIGAVILMALAAPSEALRLRLVCDRNSYFLGENVLVHSRS